MNINTRSRIGIIKKDGSIESIYCHCDGYVEGVGNKLNKFYYDYEKVKKLIYLGNIEKLKEQVEVNSESKDDLTIAYHRNHGESLDKHKAMVNNTLDEFNKVLFDRWVGYIYLYDEKENKWLWDNYSNDKNELVLKSLDERLNQKICIKNISCNEVKELRNGRDEYLVLQGCGGNLNEFVNDFLVLLKDYNIVSDSFSFDEVFLFENNKLTNLAFSLNSVDIDFSKLAMFRLKMRDSFGAMWLSDYIDNGYIKDINI